MAIDYSQRIPNNVDLVERPPPAARAGELAAALPRLVEGHGAGRHVDFDVYLRTAISADANGWANFGYVKMPDYRWGIFLAGQRSQPRTSPSATTRASRPGRRCRASCARPCAA